MNMRNCFSKLEAIPARIEYGCRELKAKVDSSVKGWNNVDVSNAGTCFLLRLGGMLEVLGSLDYEPNDKDWANRVKRAGTLFKSYATTPNELFDMFLDDEFHVEENKKKKPVASINRALKQMDERFLEEWNWVGTHVFSDLFVVAKDLSEIEKGSSRKDEGDSLYVEEPQHSVVDGIVSSAAGKIADPLLREATQVVKRIISPTPFIKDDLAAMPYGELTRLSNILLELVSKCDSHPLDYLQNDSLRKRDDGWMSEQALTAWILGPSSNLQEFSEDVGNESRTIKSNKDVGADYSAWLEDLYYASSILEKYVSWKTEYGFKYALESAGVGYREREDIGMRLTKEFCDVWMWIGRNINNIGL